jgi:hypothetical protein
VTVAICQRFHGFLEPVNPVKRPASGCLRKPACAASEQPIGLAKGLILGYFEG